MKRPPWTTFFTIPLLPSSEFSLSYDICYKFMALLISVGHKEATYYCFIQGSVYFRKPLCLAETFSASNTFSQEHPIASQKQMLCTVDISYVNFTKRNIIPSKPVFQEHDRKCLVLVNSRTFDIHPKVGVSSSPGLRHFLSQNALSLSISPSREYPFVSRKLIQLSVHR